MKLSQEFKKQVWLNCQCKCIIRNNIQCGFGYSPSHLFKANTMTGNPYWDYEDINNAVVMCNKHHAEYEKLNALERIQYMKDYAILLKDKIVSRMEKLIKREKPESIY